MRRDRLPDRPDVRTCDCCRAVGSVREDTGGLYLAHRRRTPPTKRLASRGPTSFSGTDPEWERLAAVGVRVRVGHVSHDIELFV